MPEPSSMEAIFHTALALLTVERRAAYLEEASGGDEGLRRRIERLLRAHSRSVGFLERPIEAAANLSSLAPADEGASDTWSEGEQSLGFLAPSSRPDSLGHLGHYEIFEVVGQGGTGIVMRAFDEQLHRVVAIKALAPALAAIRTARWRFVREARGAASVIHDNVVAIHAVEDGGSVPYLVMAFVAGRTLQEKLDRDGPLPVEEILRIGMQVAAGLGAAHAQGLVHRDVKPANILLEIGVERVKITDFGLACAVDDPRLTQPGLIAGTPAYMSPEQANGEHLDPRSDLFSLGSVLYALCTGDAPFRAHTMIAVLKRVCDQAARPIREVNPSIPAWLEALIARLHAKDPAGRPQTAAEVVALLGRHLADLQEPNRLAVPDDERGQGPSGRTVFLRGIRHRWVAAAAAVALLCVGLGATEAAGVTNFRGVVVHLLFPDGTMIVEVDDPAVSVAIDGTDLVITGSGVREIRLKPGAYQVRASKDGRIVRRELVKVVRDGRQLVRISKESDAANEAQKWENSVAGLPAENQVEAVALRLKERNPGFDGVVTPTLQNGKVIGLRFRCDEVADLSPVRALAGLRLLECQGTSPNKGKIWDLTPLRGLPLQGLMIDRTLVADLGPLQGMPLSILGCSETLVSDLTPLKGMSLETLFAQWTRISDLSPLRGMPLKWLDLCGARQISDLDPLKGLPLDYLNLTGLPVSDIALIADAKTLRMLLLDEMPVSDLTPLRGLGLRELSIRGILATDLTPIEGLPLKGLRLDYRADREKFVRSFAGLESINDKPAAEFWKDAVAR